MLSPAASAASADHGALAGAAICSSLPPSRTHPLKPGSRKEIALINYLDDKILQITRRYGKKFSSDRVYENDAPGYTNFVQVVEDISATLDVVWVSATATIQIPYLLSLAGLFCSYMPAFPFSSTCFALAKKLDTGFTRLLQPAANQGSVSQTTAYEVSITDRVRIKSLVEDTRVIAVQTATRSGHATSTEGVSSSEDTDSEYPEDSEMPHESESSVSNGIAKMYKRTIEILGDSLT